MLDMLDMLYMLDMHICTYDGRPSRRIELK